MYIWLKYLFFSGLGTLLFFVPVFLLFRSSLFFFVLFVVLFLLSFLGRGFLRSVVLLEHDRRQCKLNNRRSYSRRGQVLCTLIKCTLTVIM